MFDDAYICEINLFLAERAIDDFIALGGFLSDLNYLSDMKNAYSVAISTHGGW